MLEFKDLDYRERVSNGLVLVDIWAPWCGPCKAIAPTLEELSVEYDGQVVFGKLNTDENPEITAHLQVRNIPTLLLYKNGSVVEKIVGLSNKAKIKETLEKYLN